MRNNYGRWFLVLILAASLGLTSCAQHRHKREIQQFVAQLKAEAAKAPSAPLVGLNPPPPVVYTAKDLRSPFETSSSAISSKIASQHPLQSYPLNVLIFKGTVTQGKETWAFILAPDKKLYQVKIGDMIGDHYGKILDISPTNLVIQEQGDKIIPLGKPSNRIVTLRLQESS